MIYIDLYCSVRDLQKCRTPRIESHRLISSRILDYTRAIKGVSVCSLIEASLSEPHTSESFRWIVILRGINDKNVILQVQTIKNEHDTLQVFVSQKFSVVFFTLSPYTNTRGHNLKLLKPYSRCRSRQSFFL